MVLLTFFKTWNAVAIGAIDYTNLTILDQPTLQEVISA